MNPILMVVSSQNSHVLLIFSAFVMKNRVVSERRKSSLLDINQMLKIGKKFKSFALYY